MTRLEERLLTLEWIEAKRGAEHHESVMGTPESGWEEFHRRRAASLRRKMSEIEAKLSMEAA